MTITSQQTLRQLLSCIAHRFAVILKDLPEDFAAFDAGNDVRPPNEILRHMAAVVKWARSVYVDEEFDSRRVDQSWSQNVDLLYANLQEFDQALVESPPPDDQTILRLIYGPLADVITHIGQLAMLRRMAGAPIVGANYFRTEMPLGSFDYKS